MSWPVYQFSDHAERQGLPAQDVEKHTKRAFEIIRHMALLGRCDDHGSPLTFDDLEKEFETLLAARPCPLDLLAREQYSGGSNNYTLFHAATECGFENLFKKLIDAGAPIDAPSISGTPLVIALRSGNKPFAEHLLALGVNIEGVPHAGCMTVNGAAIWDRPLQQAVQRGYDDIVLRLVQQGAKLHFPCITPLLRLACDRPSTTQLLFDLGANPNRIDSVMSSDLPLFHIATLASENVLRIWLNNGADITNTIGYFDPQGPTPVRNCDTGDSLTKLQMLFDCHVQASRRSVEIISGLEAGTLDFASVTAKDLVLCANLNLLDRVITDSACHSQRQHMQELLSQLPVWMVSHIVETAPHLLAPDARITQAQNHQSPQPRMEKAS